MFSIFLFIYVGSFSADIGTTHHLLTNYPNQYHEAGFNPFGDLYPNLNAAAKVAIGSTSVYALYTLHKTNPKLAWIIMIGLTGMETALTIRNLKFMNDHRVVRVIR